MFRKLLLLLCIAFAVVGFGYPCVIMPYTNYTATASVLGNEVNMTFNFKFNGKVTVKNGNDDATAQELYYKIDFKNNQVVISANKDFKDSMKLTISSFYRLNFMGANATNKVAMYTSIGVGVVALLLVLTIPRKRKR